MCKQSNVNTQNTIKTHNNNNNLFAIYPTCTDCPGARNKAIPALIFYFRFNGHLFPVVMMDGELMGPHILMIQKSMHRDLRGFAKKT